MCQGGGKPDTGMFHSSYIGMNVCMYVGLPMRMVRGQWHVQRIEYYYYCCVHENLLSI